MGRIFDEITAQLRDWIEQQPVFFVGTAPNGDDGHINVSPKGARETFAVTGPRSVAYIDLIGSGIETVSHLRENGRIVLMFCAFTGPPKIVRLHGRGRTVLRDDPEFMDLLDHFVLSPEVGAVARTVVVVDVTRIADSCGYVVPRMELVDERDQLFRWAETREAKDGPDWQAEYQREKNAVSIDGLPGIGPVAADQPTPALEPAG
jgi:hypothetical protein